MPTNIECSLPDITVGDRDHSLIEWILEEIPQRERFPIAVMLDQELARARIIPASEVPASVAVADAFKRTARRLRDHRSKQMAFRTRTMP